MVISEVERNGTIASNWVIQQLSNSLWVILKNVVISEVERNGTIASNSVIQQLSNSLWVMLAAPMDIF